jgi:hypothetical protein
MVSDIQHSGDCLNHLELPLLGRSLAFFGSTNFPRFAGAMAVQRREKITLGHRLLYSP